MAQVQEDQGKGQKRKTVEDKPEPEAKRRRADMIMTNPSLSVYDTPMMKLLSEHIEFMDKQPNWNDNTADDITLLTGKGKLKGVVYQRINVELNTYGEALVECWLGSDYGDEPDCTFSFVATAIAMVDL